MHPKFSKAPWLIATSLQVAEPKPKFSSLGSIPALEVPKPTSPTSLSITNIHGLKIADVEWNGESTEPNAHLMAAAPALYRQLVWAYTQLLSGVKVNVDDEEMARTRSALDLANGEDGDPPTAEQTEVLRKYLDVVCSQQLSDDPYKYEEERMELHEKILGLYGFYSHLETSDVTSSITPLDDPSTLHKKLKAIKLKRAYEH